MKQRALISVLLLLAPGLRAHAQVTQTQDPPSEEKPYETRYSFATINDATFYGDPQTPQPSILNQVLLELTFSLRYRDRWKFSTSLVGFLKTTAERDSSSETNTRLNVKEAYGGFSEGDLDFTLGRKMVRWGTGYAFTAAGVLDPPRDPTNPTDRLNTNQGRDMIKADWVHGQHALTVAYSTDELAPAGSTLHDTTAFRYNVLVHGFDTSLIAGNDRGVDTFGALTFTRVTGQAWEIHGEAAWSEQGAILGGAKYATPAGVTFIGEFFTQPDTPYFRDMSPSHMPGRQNYGFFNVSKSRLRERPGWKEWDLSGSIVTDFNDHSYTAVFDVNRWFGNHFSSYLHVEVPQGSSKSEYGSAPNATATSVGVRFHL
jgi:hypothetical protein